MTDGVTTGTHLLADRYQIGEQLGRGGMAEVHAGFDTRLGRQVAVKLLRPALANDPAFRTRFRQEAQAAARMAHPTIVRVYDAGEQTVRDGSGSEIQLPFIVMERVDGTLLRDVIAQGPVAPAEAGRIVDGILTALEYSHRAGVVHRDIKPGNVMVTPAGQAKVMDFGIARAISDSSASIAQTSAILGTAEYFSPEQARGESIDARTDLYSTGVVFYELLTGRPPFHADTAVAVAYQHLSQTPVPPATLNPAVSPALNAVVLRALAKDRFDRFQSAAEFREALQAALEGKVADRVSLAPTDDFTSTLFGVNPGSTAASEATLRRLTETTDERAPRTQSRPPVALIWASVAVVAVIVVAALYWVFTLAPQQLVGSQAAVVVPDVVGQVYGDGGSQALVDEGLNVTRVEANDPDAATDVILSTEPPAGTTVTPGTTIEVTVSAGAQQVALPNLSYQKESEAIENIEARGLVYAGSSSTFSPNVKEGRVIGVQLADSDEVIAASTPVRAGSEVMLVVSNGKVKIPDVEGTSIEEASTQLSGELQLNVKLVPDFGCDGDEVVNQSKKGEQKQKSDVELTFCAKQ